MYVTANERGCLIDCQRAPPFINTTLPSLVVFARCLLRLTSLILLAYSTTLNGSLVLIDDRESKISSVFASGQVLPSLSRPALLPSPSDVTRCIVRASSHEYGGMDVIAKIDLL